MLKETKKFHNRTKLEKVLDDVGGEIPIEYVHTFYKTYPRLPYVTLPSVDRSDSYFETLLEARQSSRNFSDTPMTLEEVSMIMGSCRITRHAQNFEGRTYPSGGARFPIELYLFAFNVAGLDQGAYHYNIRDSTLEVLLKRNIKERQRELISPYLENPAATIVFTSVISRSEVKYGYKAYPLSLIEAGHMGQNIHLACAEICVGSCSVSGFVNDTTSELLDLSPDEIPIYTISMGKRRALI